MEPQKSPTPTAPTQPTTPDLSFQVMPQDMTHAPKSMPNNSLPPPVPVKPSNLPVSPAAPHAPVKLAPPLGSSPALTGSLMDSDLMPMDEPNPSFFANKKLLYIVVGAVVLIILGVMLFMILGTKKQTPAVNPPATPNASTSKLPKVWLQQYFVQNLDTANACNDQTICGDDADSDNDGLTNYDEFKSGTSPILADTDSDGLADGDEIKVYKTDPALQYTDRRVIVQQNNWTDGYQIKNGYDPLTPGIKFTDSRTQQILADAKTNALHEPTMTTLGVNADATAKASVQIPPVNPNAKTVTINFENSKFDPSSITINKGDTVVWLNKQATTIHISSTVVGLESSDLTAQQTYSYKFATTGTFNYFDKSNPMIKGTVIVQ